MVIKREALPAGGEGGARHAGNLNEEQEAYGRIIKPLGARLRFIFRLRDAELEM